MKIITKHLVKFTILATILIILFRFCLSYGIENQSYFIVIFSAITYSLAMYLAGWTYGKKDREFLPIHDVGFRFHLVTYFTHNMISELWFILGFNTKHENIAVIHLTGISWGIFLIIHFIFFLKARKNSINHLDKEDLFD